MEEWALSLDIGTSSARAMLFDATGQSVEGCKTQVEYRMRADPPGTSECDVDSLVEHAARCIDDALLQAGANAGRIAGVGVSTFWHSMVGVGSDGRALTPLYTWADTRACESARRLRKRLDSDAIHARTGCRLHPSYFPARLVWLSETDPDTYGRVARWLSPGEYLFQQLFGEARCSLSMASATGLFDQNACDWDAEMLQAVSVDRSRLAPLTDIDQPMSGLRREWAQRWPGLASVPWTPAIGDGAASNLGSGCATDRRIAINLGTSGAIRVLWQAEQVQIPEGLWCYRLDRNRFVMGAAFSDGGDAYAWLRRTAILPDDAELERQITQRAPDGHGLTFLPFLAGERSMGWHLDARASLHGLTLATTPTDIAQAVMEGVALQFVPAADALSRIFPNVEKIVGSGGALASSPLWAQMMADALGRPLALTAESEATSRGAALVALRSLGLVDAEYDVPTAIASTVQPDAAHHAIYRQALDRRQTLYRKTFPDSYLEKGVRP